MFEDVESENDLREGLEWDELMEIYCNHRDERSGSELGSWQWKWRGTDARAAEEGEP